MDLSHESGNNILDDNSLKEIFAANSALVVIEKGRKYLEALGLRVPISNSSFAKMSSLLFDKAKELENGGRSIESAEARLLIQLNSLKAHTSTIRHKIDIKENITKQWYERYRWFFTSQGLLAIGGNDATSNSAIIRKHLADNDIVFHAEVHGSPFFVLKDAMSVSEKSDSLTEVAQATVSFSRAWKDELSSADAYWVEPSQVKRGAPTGQFLPRGSFVIQGRRNYIKGMEIKLAVGLVRSSGSYIVVCGPPAAVQRQSVIYVQLLPGGVDPNNVAKKIKTELVKAASTSDHSEEFTNRHLVEFVKSLGIGTFLGVIPSGHSKVSLAAKGAAAKSFSHDINR
jgi:Tfp pilus assembly protein PilZ